MTDSAPSNLVTGISPAAPQVTSGPSNIVTGESPGAHRVPHHESKEDFRELWIETYCDLFGREDYEKRIQRRSHRDHGDE